MSSVWRHVACSPNWLQTNLPSSSPPHMFYMSSSGHRRYWKCKLLSALFLCVLLFDCCACVLFHYFCELSKSLACLDTRLQVLSRLVIHSTHPPHTQKTVRAAAVFFIFGFLGVSFTSLTCSKRNRSSTGREEKNTMENYTYILFRLGLRPGRVRNKTRPHSRATAPRTYIRIWLAIEKYRYRNVFYVLFYFWFDYICYL